MPRVSFQQNTAFPALVLLQAMYNAVLEEEAQQVCLVPPPRVRCAGRGGGYMHGCMAAWMHGRERAQARARRACAAQEDVRGTSRSGQRPGELGAGAILRILQHRDERQAADAHRIATREGCADRPSRPAANKPAWPRLVSAILLPREV